MAYEVVKKRGKNAYRYTVEYYRDSLGKGRTRWRYLGPVSRDAQASDITAGSKEAKTATSGRLLDALERLLARQEYATVTAGAIALEARVAHGTFYRHFKDKRDALRAVMQRLSATAEPLTSLGAPTSSREAERLRVREWVCRKLTTFEAHPGLWRAWSALSENDPLISALRQSLRMEYRATFAQYLEQLHVLGHGHIEDPTALSRVIFALTYGVLQDGFAFGNSTPSVPIIEQTCRVVDQAIFGALRQPINLRKGESMP